MSNLVPNNIPSELSTLSDLLELHFPLFDHLEQEEILPDSLRPIAIEAVCLPPINPPIFNNEPYQLENVQTVDREFLDISNSIRSSLEVQIENAQPFSNPINLLNNQNIESNQIESKGTLNDSNTIIMKLMKAQDELKELEEVRQRLENENRQLEKEIDEIKQQIIEFVKMNKIKFNQNIKKSIKRKNSSASSLFLNIPSPIQSTSTCSFESSERKSRGRPNKDLDEAARELEEVKSMLTKNEFRIMSNNLASIKARKNRKIQLNELSVEEQKLLELNKDLNEKFKRYEEEIERIVKTAFKSGKNL